MGGTGGVGKQCPAEDPVRAGSWSTNRRSTPGARSNSAAVGGTAHAHCRADCGTADQRTPEPGAIAMNSEWVGPSAAPAVPAAAQGLPSPGVRPRQREGVLSCAVFEDVVLMAPSSDKAFVLNTSSRAIWDLCDGGRNVLAILRDLQSRYDAPAESLQDDLAATLSEFARAGLIDFNDAAT